MRTAEILPGVVLTEYGELITDLHVTHSLAGNGYPAFYIKGIGGGTLHRFVATCFVPNPHNHPNVLHITNDKMNCHASNLRWGTQKDNMQDRLRDGTYCNRKLNEAQVMEILDLLAMDEFQQQDIADMFDTTQSTISLIKTGTTHKKTYAKWKAKQ